ncbi:MAG: PAS domain S-box protein [Candidatus Omnitrophota bacterium]
MNIRIKIMFLLAFIMCMFIGVFIVNQHSNSERLKSYIKNQTKIMNATFGNILKLKGSSVETLASDYTFWDEMVAFISTKSEKWAAENIDVSLSTYKVDFIWVYDVAGSLVYYTNSKEDGRLWDLPIPKEVFGKLAKEKLLLGFFADTPAGLMEFCAATIHPSADSKRETAPLGYFFAGRLWDDVYIKELSRLIGGPVAIVPFDEGELLVSAAKSESDAIVFSKSLSDWSGREMMKAMVWIEVPFIRDMAATSRRDMVIISTLAAVCLVVLTLLIGHWITIPLGLITTTLKTGDTGRIEDLGRRKTEFGGIARLIRLFFTQREALVKEMSERKIAVAKLEESEERYRGLYNSIRDGIVLVNISGDILDCNQAYLDMLGYTMDEVKRLTYIQVTPAKWHKMEAEIIRQRVLAKGFSGDYEKEYTRKDGTVFPILLNTWLVRGEDGRPAGMWAIIKDITEQKRMLDQLRDSEIRYRTIYETSADAIMLLTPGEGFFRGNPSAVKMYECVDEDDFTSYTPAILSPEYQPDGRPSAEKAREMMAMAMEHGSHFFEWLHKTARGREFFATVLLTRVELEGKVFLQATVRDITESKRRETELKSAYEKLKYTQLQLVQASKMASMGTLAGGIAHEINNPLAGVMNNVHLVKMILESKGYPDSNDLAEVLMAIEADVFRCKKITQSLLNFSHVSKGEYKQVSLNDIADEVLNIVGHEVRVKNISIDKRLTAGIPGVIGDSQLLQQVVFDLVNNAMWAISTKSDKGGVVGIETTYDSVRKSVVLTISDTGVGIPEENINKIFDPFFTTKPVGEGTGLGLSVAYNIVKGHNGVLAVESQVGVGTKFSIALPAVLEGKRYVG